MRASNSSVAPRVRARESATAPAGSAAISRAAFKPSVSTSSGATTMLAMPNSLACVALSGCPMTRNSNARRWPIRRGASRLEAASGIRPRLTNGVEKNASEPATTKSQWNSIVVPTPTATPLTAATIGLLQRTSVGRKSSAGRLRPPELSAALRKSARSLPAENAPGTPAISTQRTESSAFAPSSAAVIASYMASVSAFFLSGRFIRMVRMPSTSVTITCSVVKALEPRLSKCAEAGYGFADDQRVHIARAFIGIGSFGVGNVATHMVLERLPDGPRGVLRSGRLLQHGGVERQLAQALAGCREDRVGNRGNDSRGSGFAHPARRLGALEDVNLDGGRLVHAQHLVGIEVGLLDTAVFQRDLAVERRRDAEDDPALDLRLHGIGIDHSAAIDRADDAPDANRSVLRHFDFGNVRHVGGEDELQGDAAADPFRQRLSPAGLFRGKREDRFGARCLVEQGQPIGGRILFRRSRELIHEAFGHEDIVRRPDAAPEGRRNARLFHPHILDVHIRQRISQIDRALA